MADATQMIPFDTTGMGNGWSPAIGAFVGSLFGDWFGGGYGYGGGYGRGNSVVQSADQTMLLDNLNHLSDQVSAANTNVLTTQAAQDVNTANAVAGLNQNLFNSTTALSRDVTSASSGLGRDISSSTANIVSGLAGINNNIYQSTAGITRDMTNGMGNVTNAVTRSTYDLSSGMQGGFNNTINAINQNGSQARFDTMNGLNNLQNTVSSCSCLTQTALANGFADNQLNCCQNTGKIIDAINAQGAITRELINSNYISDLQQKLNDSKSEVNALETQQYTNSVVSAQSTLFDTKLSNAINVIINSLKTTASGTA